MVKFGDVSDEIRGCITTIRDRAGDHSSVFSSNETATRVQLINPLLRALGWDVEDPDRVRHEHLISSGKLDYALRFGSHFVAIVEAKSGNTKVGSQTQPQLMKYARDPDCEQLQAVALSNGTEWIVHRESKNWLTEKVDLLAGEVFEAAYALFELLHSSQFGDGLHGRIEIKDQGRESAGTDSSPGTTVRPSGWHKLSPELPIQSKPRAIRFAGGRPIRISSWKGYWVEVAKYLVRAGKIRPSDMPLRITRTGFYLMNRVNRRQDGKEFHRPAKIGDGIWMEALGSAGSIRTDSIRLLTTLGIDASIVEVKFDHDQHQAGEDSASGGGADGSYSAGPRGWVALSNSIPTSRPPAEIRFDRGKPEPIRSWRDVFEAVATHLIDRGRIKPLDIPFKITSGSRYAINWSPIHENAAPFAAARSVGEGIWAEANYSARDAVKYSAALMEKFGADPHQCEVRLV